MLHWVQQKKKEREREKADEVGNGKEIMHFWSSNHGIITRKEFHKLLPEGTIFN